MLCCAVLASRAVVQDVVASRCTQGAPSYSPRSIHKDLMRYVMAAGGGRGTCLSRPPVVEAEESGSFFLAAIRYWM